MSKLAGLWLPIITPFADGAVDLQSYESLLEHYLGQGVAGIFPLGTTGEAPTIEDEEVERIVDLTMTVVAGRVPVFVGIGGNATRKVVKVLKRLEHYSFAGLVSVCPYYNRPSQDGLREHFVRIAEATDRKILIYNIPYRTSINLANETLLRLAEIPNIVAAECRLPLTQVSAALAGELDHMLGLEHTLRYNGRRGIRELRDNIGQASDRRSVGLPRLPLLCSGQLVEGVTIPFSRLTGGRARTRRSQRSERARWWRY
jgi:dihydrodipicolinate synthase/N-acetylneuraminate lyase